MNKPIPIDLDILFLWGVQYHQESTANTPWNHHGVKATGRPSNSLHPTSMIIQGSAHSKTQTQNFPIPMTQLILFHSPLPLEAKYEQN